MAEEIHSANIVIPWCMLTTTLLNGILGFAMLLAILFVTTDIGAALASPAGTLGFPFMQIFYTATNTLPGASAMISIVIIMDICAAIAFLATSSRIVFAFGRDKGLPFWRTMATVQDDSAIPLYAIMVMALVSCVIGLINIGSAIAFNAIISVGVSSLYACFDGNAAALASVHTGIDPKCEKHQQGELACQRTGLGPVLCPRCLGHLAECLCGGIWDYCFRV